MRYQVIIRKSVKKELDRLPDDVASRILTRLSELETNPRPNDVKKLKNRDAWRIRVGDYLVLEADQEVGGFRGGVASMELTSLKKYPLSVEI